MRHVLHLALVLIAAAAPAVSQSRSLRIDFGPASSTTGAAPGQTWNDVVAGSSTQPVMLVDVLGGTTGVGFEFSAGQIGWEAWADRLGNVHLGVFRRLPSTAPPHSVRNGLCGFGVLGEGQRQARGTNEGKGQKRGGLHGGSLKRKYGGRRTGRERPGTQRDAT